MQVRLDLRWRESAHRHATLGALHKSTVAVIVVVVARIVVLLVVVVVDVVQVLRAVARATPAPRRKHRPCHAAHHNARAHCATVSHLCARVHPYVCVRPPPPHLQGRPRSRRRLRLAAGGPARPPPGPTAHGGRRGWLRGR